MPGLYTEADYENSVVELFRNMGYSYLYGPDVERDFYNPLYEEELITSLHRLNRSLPEDAISDALFKLKNIENGELVQKNVIDWLFGHIKTYDRSVAKFIFMKQNPDRC